MKQEKIDAVKKALLAVGKEPDELHKPYFDVPPIYKEHWVDYYRIPKRFIAMKKRRTEPKWFVVRESYDGDCVSCFHTKKEALKDMKGCCNCYLIKGKIVK